ncbi:MAG: cob(I)yrinic acid a,c-diamide adenosyltransferase [bacterium]|nr:cob(I)yrinic acid a,c-diamide adenosyltransferase [bacterium]
MLKTGLVQVYTGNGKGKTTAAIGQAIRAKGNGLNVYMIQFLKKDDSSGEQVVLRELGVDIKCFGHDYAFCEKLGQERKKKAKDFFKKIIDKIANEIEQKHYDLVILDEVNLLIRGNLLDKERLVEFLKNKPQNTELILTGRGEDKEIIELSDLVTRYVKIKHPYDKKIKARLGIEL